jgi:hypothetical protein
MKKIFFWLFIAIISASFPNLILAQDSGNLSRAQIIDRQMDCVDSQLSTNKGIGWNDICTITQTPQGNDPSTDQAAADKSAAADTADSTADSTNLSNPLFKPLRGQLIDSSSAYTFSRSVSNSYNYQGVKTSTNKGNENSFSQELRYGLNNNLSLSLTDYYDFDRTYDVSTSNGAVTEHSDWGFTDPEFGVDYRWLNQDRSPVDLDFIADYAPNIFTDKSGTGNKVGTEAEGRQEASFETAVGRRFGRFSIQGTTTADYLGDQEYQVLSNDNHNNVKESWQYVFGLNTQTSLTDRFSISLDTAYNLYTNQKASDINSGISWISIPDNVWAFTTDLNYQIIIDKLEASLTYTYDDDSNSKNLYANPMSDNEIKQHSDNIFGVKIAYLFG